MRAFASRGERLPDIVISDFIQTFLKLSGILQEGEQQGLFVTTSPIIAYFMIVVPFIFLKNLKGLIQRNQESLRIQGLHAHTFEEMKNKIEKPLLNALH